jgi:hypothetical protein
VVVLTFLIFLITVLLAFLPINHTGKLSKIFLIAIGVILVLFSGFRIGSQFPDYSSYLILYEDIKSGDVIVELSFVFIAKFVHFVFNNVLFVFLIYALLGVSLKLAAIKQLTNLWLLSVVVYVGNFFILHEMIQIRVGVAAAFLLLCVKPIYDRDIKKFLLFALLAIFFHISSLIILPLWFLGKFKDKANLYFLTGLIPIAYVIYFLKVTVLNFIPIPYVQDKLDLYAALQELGTADFFTDINVFNYVFLAKIIIFYFLLYKHKLLMTHNKYTIVLLNLYAVSLFMYPALAMMPVLAGRVNELLGIVEIVLFPLLYYIITPRYISASIIVIWSLGLLLINIFKSSLII